MTLPFEADTIALWEACELALRVLRIPAKGEKPAELSPEVRSTAEKAGALPTADDGPARLDGIPLPGAPELGTIAPGGTADPMLSAAALSQIFARDARRFD